jgi:hypothetical protein
MNDEQFAILTDKLDLLTSALLLSLVGDLEFKQKVIELSKLGVKESDIVKLLGEPRGRVHMTLMRHKQK